MKSGWGREALSKVQDSCLEVRQGSEGPSGSPGGVGRPFWMSGLGWEAIPEVLEALPKVWEGSEGPPEGLGWVGRPSR